MRVDAAAVGARASGEGLPCVSSGRPTRGCGCRLDPSWSEPISRRSRMVSDMILTEHTRITVLCLAGLAFGSPQAAPQAQPQAQQQTSELAFKNIQVLKGIPVDDFLGTMGIMSAALGIDCSECHANAGTEKVDWAADTPRKAMARKMVTMMPTINRTNFAGRQVVTCWSCHRGRPRPATTPAMDT